MKGDTLLINGERWTVVDVAPAAPLADMVAALLREEGFLVRTRGPDGVGEVFKTLGATNIGTTLVLVPEREARGALRLVEETVTDYEGEELESLLTSMTDEEQKQFWAAAQDTPDDLDPDA